MQYKYNAQLFHLNHLVKWLKSSYISHTIELLLKLTTMLFQLLAGALVATMSSANPSGHPSWHSKDSCIDFFVDVPVDTVTYMPVFPPFTSQYEATEFLLQITSRTAPSADTVLSGPKNLSTTFKISARYCAPSEHGYGESADTVLVLTHGLGFDKR